MLFPKKVKYRRWQRQRVNPKKKQVATRGITIAFGEYGMVAKTGARVRSNQIESARKVLARNVGKTGRVYIRIFPDRPWTQKGAETPMGKGKGDLQGYEVEVKPGRVVFEVAGIDADKAKAAIMSAGKKLPVLVSFRVK